MNQRLLSLSVLVAVVLGIAVWLSQPTPSESQADELFGELAEQLSQINRVEVANAEGTMLVAEWIDGQWSATNLAPELRYPLASQALINMVDNLSKARVLEAKTARAKNYHVLGVDGLDKPDSQARQITLATPATQWRVLIGLSASSGLGDFVRQPEQAQAYLIDQHLTLPESSEDWLKLPLADLEASVLSTLQLGDEAPLQFSKMEDDSWQLIGLGEDESMLYPGVLERSIDEILNLEFSAVTPVQDVIESVPHAVLTLTSGETVELFLSGDEQQGFRLQFNAGGELLWLTQWQYQLSPAQAQPLLVSRSDLVAAPAQ